MDDRANDPIRHVVVLGHPAKDSFNRAVAEAYCEAVRESGQKAVLRDLYAIGFDPLLKAEERPGSEDFVPTADVQAEIDLLRDSAIVTLIYPIWFGMPPAIIKGYIDRVLGAGFAARNLTTGTPHRLLHGKRLMLFSSSASTLPWLEEQGQWMGLRQAFETYLSAIFGMEQNEHVHFDAIVDGLQSRFVEEHLATVREKARAVCAAMLSERHESRFRSRHASSA